MVDNKVQVENPLNKPMHYGNQRPEVGVVQDPGRLPAKNLYSGYEQSQIYNALTQDLYTSQKKTKARSRKTPKIIKIALWLLGARILYAVAKPPVAKVLRKIFRRG